MNRNTSFFWLTDTLGSADEQDDSSNHNGEQGDTGLLIDGDDDDDDDDDDNDFDVPGVYADDTYASSASFQHQQNQQQHQQLVSPSGIPAHSPQLIPFRSFLPPPPPRDEEAQPLLMGQRPPNSNVAGGENCVSSSIKSYGSQPQQQQHHHNRPLFALTENSPVDRTPPIVQRRRLVLGASEIEVESGSNPTTNKNTSIRVRKSNQNLRFQVV